MKVSKDEVLKTAERVRTLKEGASELGITPERFRQILRKAGSTTFKNKARSCTWCHKLMTGVPGNTKFCSLDCREAAQEKRRASKLQAFVCKECGKEGTFPKRLGKRTFCNKKCQGRFLGKHYGKGKVTT